MELLSQAACATAASSAAQAGVPVRIGMIIGSTANSSGGMAQALQSLTRTLLQGRGTAVEVFSMAAKETVSREDWSDALLHQHRVRGPASFAYAPALSRSLDSRPIDLLHLHGLWMYCSVATRRWALRTGKPYLISPHGMLDAWALRNSGRKKQIARALYENDNLGHAACLHALCEPEQQAIRDCGLTGPICIIPNGVDPAPDVRPAPPEWRYALPPQALVLLYLGRLHPKKRVLELLRAWHLAGDSNSGGASAWHLVIAGPGPADYVQVLRDCIAQLGLASRVRLIGPQYGAAKQATLAAADAFILPSVSEGLPIAALEAWAWGLPALLTPYCNLPLGFGAGAALQIETDPAGIAAGLRALFALSEAQRREMGRNGCHLVSARFSWTGVAAEFNAVYRWLLGKGDCPSCVNFA
jgi:glycosyltransferase involved in cell wall biosynthesis